MLVQFIETLIPTWRTYLNLYTDSDNITTEEVLIRVVFANDDNAMAAALNPGFWRNKYIDHHLYYQD
eukprot:14295634-Ditylum_brightwellii.AAC.1